MFNAFQDLLESLAHQDVCGEPYPLDQAPYGALAVQLRAAHATPTMLGALMMEEAITARTQMDEHVLCDVLATTTMVGCEKGVILFWPEEKFTYDR